MFSLSALVLTALVCLILGAIIGYLVLGNVGTQSANKRSLETRLQAAEQQLKDYQSQVTHHFEKTSELVNNLTASYREVHEHLASGAVNLATPEVGRQFLGESNRQWLDAENAGDLLAADAQIEPPKDWAPEKGTLSESFGLNDPAQAESLEESKFPKTS
ncbi:YhcB family protein [Halioxenophilus sp. WMMB6]|uniref:YhcB family protein n=1 Tax=Halioxenophilus sp. WMMB6 TaxID=3073815 RepID=UPI00295F4C5D|nr:DUF1043 family protein [Halioxenophilus sp. WMMB6]